MSDPDLLAFRDSREVPWVGLHHPELIDLRGIFGKLIELAPADELSTQAWRQALPPDVHLVRLLGPRTAHVHWREAGVQNLVLKLSLPRAGSTWRQLAARVRHSRARRAYLWAHRLRALGIDTPRALGFLEAQDSPALTHSFVVSEYIFAPTLVEMRDRGLAAAEPRTSDFFREKHELIGRVADTVRRLHDEGVFHGDLHAGNLLVDDSCVWVIDLESVRPLAWRSPREQNLVRLNRDFLDTRLLSTSDRLRFLSVYLRHHPDRVAARRALFGRVHAATRDKLVARGEAFRSALLEAS